ncbi:hypothetical protein PRK78_006477 [Emydomyces testavorans]|uniref:EamA domain-containing protein n=1 Tax=Emydomyces testavorans TaxID=2070801 RepID=A0AAF0IKV3_9EURO|nr:hypothetical protein PRK78_006477 [Emydomyces testavorans]
MSAQTGSSGDANLDAAGVALGQNAPQVSNPALTDHAALYQRHGKLSAEDSSPFAGIARRTLGISLLLIVVVLWTTSNFLASTIFADNTYSKPFFVTYINTAFFTLPLVPFALRKLLQRWKERKLGAGGSQRTDTGGQLDVEESHPFLGLLGDDADNSRNGHGRLGVDLGILPYDGKENIPEKLDFRATARLSFEFCLLWANYFAFACLQYTTVGSTTILTSTSGVWTLIFGAILHVEKFTLRKLLGVIASLTGIFIISRVDLSGSSDDTRGSFPHKSPTEIAVGDAMAAFSAILYGVYTIVMKKQAGDETRVNMPLFFGLVGLWNTFIMWPGFLILHFTGLETFAWPDTQRIWIIILVNAITSLVSDICWAYAMLLTTPLVVTVGLSLTIPLSLVVQIFLHEQYSSALYWIGATIVFVSFIIVNHESKTESGE